VAAYIIPLLMSLLCWSDVYWVEGVSGHDQHTDCMCSNKHRETVTPKRF